MVESRGGSRSSCAHRRYALVERFEDGSPHGARTVRMDSADARGAWRVGRFDVDEHGRQESERRNSARCIRLALEGRTHEAVALAIGIANRAGDPRGRFRGYLVAGKTAIHAGNASVARPLLEGLLAVVDASPSRSLGAGLVRRTL